MIDELTMRLTWQGEETVKKIIEAVPNEREIELVLPGNTHHALYNKIGQHNDKDQEEMIDITAGLTLLADVASVNGLEAMTDIANIDDLEHYVVNLTSPPPRIHLKKGK